MVFQDFRLLPNKTVFENVAFALQVIGKPRHAIVHTVPEVLDLVGLAGKEQRFPHELSGGEQQRVAIARAFVNRPAILLADEPTGNLDPTTSVGIMRLLDRINRTGTTIVMATHDDEIVDQMRKRVVRARGRPPVRDQDRGVYGYAPLRRRTDALSVHPSRDRHRPAAQPVDDGLGHPRHAVSLLLLGVGILAQKQVSTMKAYWYDRVQVSIFLCGKDSDSTSCAGR